VTESQSSAEIPTMAKSAVFWLGLVAAIAAFAIANGLSEYQLGPEQSVSRVLIGDTIRTVPTGAGVVGLLCWPLTLAARRLQSLPRAAAYQVGISVGAVAGGLLASCVRVILGDWPPPLLLPSAAAGAVLALALVAAGRRQQSSNHPLPMGQRLPTSVVIILVALCAFGAVAVLLPWYLHPFFGGTVLVILGYQELPGQLSAGAFGCLAAICIIQHFWPRLPWFVPLTFALAVGAGVVAVVIEPFQLPWGIAETSVFIFEPLWFPRGAGSGIYLVLGAAVAVVVVAGHQLWKARPGFAGGSKPEPIASL
jgi:hypothetical protein